MRRCKYMLLLLLLLVLNTEAVMAVGKNTSEVFSEEQREQIKEAIREFFTSTDKLDILPIQSFDADQAFFQETCSEYIIETVRKKGSFFALSGENKQICVPTNNGEIRLQTENGKVSVLGYSVSASGEAKGFSWKKLEASLKAAGLSGNPEKVRIINSNLYHAVFTCVQLDNKEYVVVFNSMLDEAGIEDEKLYSAEDLLDKMDAYYDEEATQKAARISWLNGEVIGGGGVLMRGTPLPQINFLRLSIIGGLVILCVVLTIKRVRRKHSN